MKKISYEISKETLQKITWAYGLLWRSREKAYLNNSQRFAPIIQPIKPEWRNMSTQNSTSLVQERAW